MAEGTFYWIKLKTDFFAENSPIDFLLSQKNGSEYVVLYIKLCLSTANTDGRMCNEIGEMIIPYNIEKITKDMKHFSIDTVRVAMELYKKLGLIYREDNGTLVIANHEEMVGSETKWAKYKRDERKGSKQILGQSLDNVQQSLEIREQSVEDINISSVRSSNEQSEPNEQPVVTLLLNTGEEYPFYQRDIDDYQNTYPAVDVMQQFREMRRWCIDYPTKRKTKRGIRKFVNSWLSREQDKPHPAQGKRYANRDEQIANRISEVDAWKL
jgi:predicted phage replisome organizer